MSVRLILNWECGESGSAQFPLGFCEYNTAKHSAPGGWSKQSICRDARYSPRLWEGCLLTLPCGESKHPPAPVQLRVQRDEEVRGEMRTSLSFGLELTGVLVSCGFVGLDTCVMPRQREKII